MGENGGQSSPPSRPVSATLERLSKEYGARVGSAVLGMLAEETAPTSIADLLREWPRRPVYHPSPEDWRDEVFYFALVDRFSDGNEERREVMPGDLSSLEGRAELRRVRDAGRIMWDLWARSGAERFQGGTLQGAISKLDYLLGLGVTTLWLSPVLKQRAEENTYHGYAAQNFLDVDKRFGTRADLCLLVEEAHARGMRVIVDAVVNFTGTNWSYGRGDNDRTPPYRPHWESPYWHTLPVDGRGLLAPHGAPCAGPDDYVYPHELRGDQCYVRAGSGNMYAVPGVWDDNAEFKRSDHQALRKLDVRESLHTLVDIYRYWIALVDIDGLRVDSLAHTQHERDTCAAFCNDIQTFAESLGKRSFFIAAKIPVVGAVDPRGTLSILAERGLTAAVDFGERLPVLAHISRGQAPACVWFDALGASGGSEYDWDDAEASGYRGGRWGAHNVTMIDDHDRVDTGFEKVRFAADSCNNHQAIVGIALQLFTPGVPAIYYGTEQALASGVEPEARRYLCEYWGHADFLLREAMFGPEYPRAHGRSGVQRRDHFLHGFGPHGTCGLHAFDHTHALYRRISRLTTVRRYFAPLRRGRQYVRAVRGGLGTFDSRAPPGEVFAWSRVLGPDEEVLVIANPHGLERRGGQVRVGGAERAGLSPFMCICYTADQTSRYVRGALLEVEGDNNDAWVSLSCELVAPSEVLVLATRAAVERAQRVFREAHGEEPESDAETPWSWPLRS
eukprot:m51a1_g11052 putative alpha-amylase (731) ;mRNA; f:507407-510030